MAAPVPAFWPQLNPRTRLWCVRDERGPIENYEHIETFGDAEGHALQLIHDAQDAAADLDDFEAQQIAEAA